jgi:sugar lactone lactonase YvrE
MKPRFATPLAAGGFVALCALVVAIALVSSRVSALPGDTIGDLVLGQGGSFTTQTCATTSQIMCTPDGVAVDNLGNVWVSELQNHRVLEFDNPLGSCGTCDLIADRVLGQGGSFTSKVCNLGGITASSMCYPADVDVDANNNVYVVDWQNNRVLQYLDPVNTDTIADQVWGQLGSFTTGTYTTSPTADTLTNPIAVATDPSGHLYISDRGMHRILEYDAPHTNTTADRVFGQFGSFTTGLFNNGGVSANSIAQPQGIGVDASGNLYVADNGNARALRFNTPISSDTTADLVFGQYGSFTSFTPNLGGVNADTLETPTDIDADLAGNVYITDTGTERTLIYDDPVNLGTTADVVFGQGGSFTSFGNNTGGLNASSQADPWAIAFDGACNLYIVEYGNNRVMEFDSPPHACIDAPTATPTATVCPISVCTATPTATNTPTETPTVCPVPNCTPTPTPTCDPGGPAMCATPTPTPTCDPSICPPTETPTATCVPAVCPPTDTPTATDTPTPTPTNTDTPTSTPTCDIGLPGADCTPTATPTCAIGQIPECTPTPTDTPTNTHTPTNTPTKTPTPTPYPTVISCGGVNTNAVALDNGPIVPGNDITIVRSDDVPDNCDADDDADGIPEYAAHVALWNESVFPMNGCESAEATDTLDMDSDGDHLTDGWECANGSDPSDALSKFLGPPSGDADGDHIPDLWEERGYNASGSSVDTDGDGCADLVEIASIDGNKAVTDIDRLAVTRRALGIYSPNAAQDYVLDISKNGVVGQEDYLFVARAALLPDWLPKMCP